jgi:glycosyltransferase involved in cell wall biosynthesis
MNSTLVSIVVNCHNSEDFIEECIESIINQSYQNFEVIVWDNKSQDQTESIVRRFCDLDSRIKYFKGEIFVPLGSARNLALSKCSGSWIAFLDSDDLWDSHFILDQITALSGKENSAFGYGFVTEFLQDSSSIKKIEHQRQKVCSEKFVFDKLLKGNFIYFSSFVMSRQALNFVENFKVEYKQAEDYELLLRLASKFEAVQTGHVYYRLHTKNLSKIQTLDLHIESLKILENYLEFTEAKLKFSYHFAKLGARYFKNKKYGFFIEFIRIRNYKLRYFFIGLGILLILRFKASFKEFI